MTKLLSILMSLQLILAPVALAAGEAPTPPGVTAGPAVAGDAEYETGMNSQGGYDFWTKQVMILSLSLVGTNILTSCVTGFTKVSIITYMLGSLTYILTEIFGAEAENQRHKKDISQLKMDESKMAKQGTDFQRQALEQRKKEEEASLEYILTKRNWMIAITAVYTAAMGIAIAEEILGRKAQAAAVISVVGAGGAKAAYDNIAKANCNGSSGTSSWIKYGAKVLAAGWSFGTSQLKDGGVINNQYVGPFLSLLISLSSFISSGITKAYDLAWARAITFGAHAALGGVVMGGLIQRQLAAEENIEKLKRVIKNFEVMDPKAPKVDVDVAVDNGLDKNGPDAKNGKIKGLAKGPKSTGKCMNEKMEISSAACGNPLKFNRQKTDLTGDLSVLDSAYGLSVDLFNSVNSQQMDKAKVAVGSLNGMAARVKAVTEKLKAKHNAILKSEGKKPIDYEKEIEKQIASYQNHFNQAAKANGLAASAPIGRADLGLESIKTAVESKVKVDKPVGGAAKAAAIEPDFGLEEDTPMEEAPAAVSSKAAESIENFEINEGDISKAKDVPIWTQLSNRYILNYTKIFNKKEEDTSPVANDEAKESAKE